MSEPHYLLDTNICIYLSKRRSPELMERFSQVQVGEAGMSLITHGELCFGAEKSQSRRQVLTNLEALCRAIPVWSLPAETSQHYGAIRRHLEASGAPIGANDLWIAAHARASGLVLVTNNLREFARVPHLAYENWVA